MGFKSNCMVGKTVRFTQTQAAIFKAKHQHSILAMRHTSELPTRIGRALVTESNPSRKWTQKLETTLHKLVSRDSLSPQLVSRVINPSLLAHHSLALGFFNWASQQPGYSHNSLTYQSILKSLSFSRHFNSIDSLLRQAKAQNFTINTSTYRSIIHSLLINKRTHKAFLVFSEVKSEILDLGTELCNSLLSGLSSEGYFGNAVKVFDEMCKRGVGFSTIGFGVFVWRVCGSFELGRVLNLLDLVKKSESLINGSVVAVLIVHGLCKSLRVGEACWMLSELRVRGFKPDFMAYRVVVEAYRLNGGSVFYVNKVLKMKRKLGVAPRSDDYREFILGLIAERRLCEAKELGEVIAEGNFPIADDVLNALIGSVSSIDPCSAMMFLNFMIGRGRFPTLLTLENLSRNLCKHRKNDELSEVYRVLSLNDYFGDIKSYAVMFLFLCKAGNVRDAYGVFQEMKKKGLCPDINMYNLLMEACCRDDLLRPAKRLWDEMFVTGCEVNLRSYNILIEKVSKMGDFEEALRLFNQMLEKGLVPDVTTYTSLLEGFCQEGKFEDAVEMFNKSVKQDLMLGQSILGTFILSLCAKGQFVVASNLLCGLTNDISRSESHVLLLKCVADAEEVSIAVEHMQKLQDASPVMLRNICTELLALLSSSSKLDPIRDLLQAMVEECAKSDGNTWMHL